MDIQQRNSELTRLLDSSRAMDVVQRYVQSYAIGRGFSHQDAEDAFAYALCECVSKPKTFADDTHFSKWLFSVARNYLTNQRHPDSRKMVGYWKVGSRIFTKRQEAEAYKSASGNAMRWVNTSKVEVRATDDIESAQANPVEQFGVPFRGGSTIRIKSTSPKPQGGRAKLVWDFVNTVGSISTTQARTSIENLFVANGYSKRFVWQNFENFLERTI